MVISRPYASLDAVERELLLIRQRRDAHGTSLERHVEALKDHTHRGKLMKDAVHDLMHSWKPAEMVKAAVQPAKGLLPVLIQLLTMRGSFKRRLFMTALSMAAPALIKRIDFGTIMHVVNGLLHKKGSAEANGMHSMEGQEEEDLVEPWA
jgi:hypothetical protein